MPIIEHTNIIFIYSYNTDNTVCEKKFCNFRDFDIA